MNPPESLQQDPQRATAQAAVRATTTNSTAQADEDASGPRGLGRQTLRARPTTSSQDPASASQSDQGNEGVLEVGEANPHYMYTRQGPKPLCPEAASIRYTNCRLPRPFVAGLNLLDNVHLDDVAYIRSKAHATLALLIHGGGSRPGLYMEEVVQWDAPTVWDVAKFLQSLVFPGIVQADIARLTTVYQTRTEDSKRLDDIYAPPWTLFLEMAPSRATEVLRDYLLWQGVFAVNKFLSFTVYPIGLPCMPWTIMVLSGPLGAVIEDERDGLRPVLGNIKTRLSENEDFRAFVHQQITRNWGFRGTVAEAVEAATDSLTVDYVTAESRTYPSYHQMAYLVMGRPVTNAPALYRRWISFFKNPREPYRRNKWFTFDIDKLVIACELCKDTTHRTRECPLPKVEGWQGADPADIYREKAKHSALMHESDSDSDDLGARVRKVVLPKARYTQKLAGTSRNGFD
ncbi:hypothetical protein OH77DRAFT_1553784 [Trametes cingulata]|nr:hypothetical protein OH77DRAFT_1553784 [Trametes cingulata]